MLLGNDLAGNKVLPDLIVTDGPCYNNEMEEEKEFFPVCAVTRAMSRKMVFVSQEAITDDVKETETDYDLKPNLHLKGTFPS